MFGASSSVGRGAPWDRDPSVRRPFFKMYNNLASHIHSGLRGRLPPAPADAYYQTPDPGARTGAARKRVQKSIQLE
jgi:hypothetical protein